MAKTILQINYTFTSHDAIMAMLTREDAESIAAVPGLMWKVWLMNEAEHEAGGIYLFESAEEARAFVNSQEMTEFAAHPVLSAFSAKFFEPDETLSKITRGPLAVAAKA